MSSLFTQRATAHLLVLILQQTTVRMWDSTVSNRLHTPISQPIFLPTIFSNRYYILEVTIDTWVILCPCTLKKEHSELASLIAFQFKATNVSYTDTRPRISAFRNKGKCHRSCNKLHIYSDKLGKVYLAVAMAPIDTTK